MTQTSLGQKIRYFRKRAGLSQSQLEVEAELNFGTVSRMENGQINPTKESLLKIADILKLTTDQIIYLIYPQKYIIKPEDIQRAISIIKARIDTSKSPVYLLDNLRRFVYAGDAALKLFGVTKQMAENLFGMHVLEFVFNPNLPIRKMLEKNFEKLALSRVYAFQNDLGYLIENGEFDETLEKLKNFPDFERIWQKAKTIKVDPYSLEERTFTLEVNGKTHKFFFANTPIEEDRRFELIEYFPA